VNQLRGEWMTTTQQSYDSIKACSTSEEKSDNVLTGTTERTT